MKNIFKNKRLVRILIVSVVFLVLTLSIALPLSLIKKSGNADNTRQEVVIKPAPPPAPDPVVKTTSPKPVTPPPVQEDQKVTQVPRAGTSVGAPITPQTPVVQRPTGASVEAPKTVVVGKPAVVEQDHEEIKRNMRLASFNSSKELVLKELGDLDKEIKHIREHQVKDEESKIGVPIGHEKFWPGKYKSELNIIEEDFKRILNKYKNAELSDNTYTDIVNHEDFNAFMRKVKTFSGKHDRIRTILDWYPHGSMWKLDFRRRFPDIASPHVRDLSIINNGRTATLNGRNLFPEFNNPPAGVTIGYKLAISPRNKIFIEMRFADVLIDYEIILVGL